jgi:hypothetical protein
MTYGQRKELRNMADKVIHEMRLIETDDGFRIELKGDKEHLKKMLFRPELMFGHKMGFGKRFRKARRGHGRGFARPWMPGCWDEESEGEPEGTPSEEA